MAGLKEQSFGILEYKNSRIDEVCKNADEIPYQNVVEFTTLTWKELFEAVKDYYKIICGRHEGFEKLFCFVVYKLFTTVLYTVYAHIRFPCNLPISLKLVFRPRSRKKLDTARTLPRKIMSAGFGTQRNICLASGIHRNRQLALPIIKREYWVWIIVFLSFQGVINSNLKRLMYYNSYVYKKWLKKRIVNLFFYSSWEMTYKPIHRRYMRISMHGGEEFGWGEANA